MNLLKLSVVAFVFCMFCFTPGVSYAQGVYFPGSVWSSNGTLSPVEKGNVLSLTHVEQGVAYRGAELFGQSTFSVDSKKYDWNRRFSNGVGARFTQSLLGHGMVRAGVSYVHERRYTFETTRQGWVASVDTWFGWQNTPQPAAGK